MDFSTIKQIVIPEGIVKKIEDGDGNIIWQKSKELQSITLSGQTTSLNRDAAFSFGGTVTAHYSDSSTAVVTSSTTFSGYNMATAGTYTVTASYTEDNVTVTATYSLTVNPIWTTIYNNSTGYNMRLWANKQWSTTNKPCNIPAEATKLKITYKASCKDAYMRLSFNTSSNAYNATGSVTKWPVNNGNSATVTTDYTNGHNIVSVIYTTSSSSYMTGYRIAGWRWYRDGTAQTQAPGSDWTGGSLYATLTITKVQAYY